jgi:phosphate starvation-inducible PhoH-like protein
VVTGDVTQVDLPVGKTSGLKEAQSVLRDIDGIGIIEFTERDVVRHRLVQDIIGAYERAEQKLAAGQSTSTGEGGPAGD